MYNTVLDEYIKCVMLKYFFSSLWRCKLFCQFKKKSDFCTRFLRKNKHEIIT